MNTRKTLLRGALVLYFVIACEVLIMSSPFAGFLYQVFNPALSKFSAYPSIRWAGASCLHYTVLPQDVLLQLISAMGSILFVLCITASPVCAEQIIFSKLATTGAVVAVKTADITAVDRFKAGNLSGFEDIVRKYQDRIYNLCRRMLENPHDAEDAAQDVFLKAFQAVPKFRPDASLYTWLYRIAINTCIDYKRKPVFESLFGGSGEEEKLVHDRASDAPSPEKFCQSKQMSRALRESLGTLSPKLRAIIILREIEELSYEEIADTLEISAGTVKSRIARAREDLQKLMKKFREQNSDTSV